MWLLGLVCFAHAQIITINDEETGEPLELATLMSENPQAFALTNSIGKADITAFKKAENITIRLLGYKTVERSYTELQAQGFTLGLAQSRISIDAVVVSATRWTQSARDIPNRIASISAKKVNLQNPQTAADLLSISDEVYIQKSQQGGGSPMIRGFSTNRLLYTIDGVRMNTAIFRGGNLQNVISLDPLAIEKTEVFFGPGSVIYGSDAIGGVMSFQTLVPQLSLSDQFLMSGKAVTRYSSANNEKTAHFDVNVGWRKWAMVTSLSSNDFGDLRMGRHGPNEYLRRVYVQQHDSTDVVVTNTDPQLQRPSGYSQINLMQKVRFKPNETWDLQFGFHFSETSDYARYDRHLQSGNGLPRYGEWNYGPQKWMMNNLSVTHTGHNMLFDQLNIRLAQQVFEESRISRDFNQPNREIRIEEVDAYSANIDFNKLVGERSSLYYGFEFVRNDITSRGINENISTGISARGPARYPQSEWASYAAYITNQFKLSDQWTLQAGIRYNQYVIDAVFDTTFYPFPFVNTSLSNGALSGSIGAVYKPTSQWTISANVARGFRSPNIDDMGKVFDSEPGAVVIPNPDLDAEYAYNADIGIATTFGENLKMDVTAYYTLLQNALVRRDFTLKGKDSILYDNTLSQVQAIQNAAVARVFGVQAGVEIALSSGFSLTSHINYQKGEEELDNGTTSPSRHAPPLFGTTRITYTASRLTMQFYAAYSGEMEFDELPEEEKGKNHIYAIDQNGNPYSPAWYTLNFKGMYQFTENLTVSAGLENLADKCYRPYSSGIVAPGRNFILSVRANF